MHEFRVKVSIRNNLMLTAIKDAGYNSLSEFARAAGLSSTAVTALVSLRTSPITRSGEFSVTARVAMEVLGACPSDLWTTAQLNMRLKKNSSEFDLDSLRCAALIDEHREAMTLPSPEDVYDSIELRGAVSEMLNNLSDREKAVVRLRFDHEGDLRTVGKQIGVTPERVRQIESKALRKMRAAKNYGKEIDFIKDPEEREYFEGKRILRTHDINGRRITRPIEAAE